MKDKAIFRAVIRTVVIFIVLLIAIFGYFSTSLGWFAKNDKTNLNGANLGVEGINVEITQISSVEGVVDDQMNVTFGNLSPGDTVSINVEISCYKEIPSLTVVISAPTGCEVPISSQGKNYYFGSEILISSITYNNQPLAIDAVGKSLLSTNPGEIWGTTENIVPLDIEIKTITPLKVGVHVFTIQFTFYNAPYNQNILKNFGLDAQSVCYREFQFR